MTRPSTEKSRLLRVPSGGEAEASQKACPPPASWRIARPAGTTPSARPSSRPFLTPVSCSCPCLQNGRTARRGERCAGARPSLRRHHGHQGLCLAVPPPWPSPESGTACKRRRKAGAGCAPPLPEGPDRMLRQDSQAGLATAALWPRHGGLRSGQKYGRLPARRRQAAMAKSRVISEVLREV